VHLVENDKTQIAQKGPPRRVIRQDAYVQHVRVADEDARTRPCRRARRRGAIAIVRGYPTWIQAQRRQVAGKALLLIMREGLGGEKQQGLLGAFQEPLQNRKLVTQRLARGSRRHHDGVLPAQRQCQRLRLVCIEPMYAPPGQHVGQGGGKLRGNRHRRWRLLGPAAPLDDLRPKRLMGAQPGRHRINVR